ncbi:MAG: hypothetical protein K8L97_31085 [Anaerolineae bacterium]|nr:hypothetical protein [Anaerolineae bacterium]
MNKEGIPLQHNMFTGAWVDNRSRNQRQTAGLQQMPMFSIHQTFTFGERIRPYLANAPRPTLELISEDTRTPEEVEQDLLREAQRHTVLMPGLNLLDTATQNGEKPDESLIREGIGQPVAVAVEGSTVQTQPQMADTTLETIFASPAVIPIEEPVDDDTEDEAEEEVLPATSPPLSKYAAYLELVRVAEERAATLSQSPAAALSETISASLAQFDAKRAGLTGNEIQMAVAIGTFRGKQQSDQQATLLNPEPEPTDEDIPILWLNRSDLIKRRPDLASVIQKLGEHEIEFIASKVGEALEEFYLIQLNVVLSLFLDHELRLFLKSPRNRGETATLSKQ